MSKSARASRIKKNNQVLKKRVFGPAEAARNERLSAKLLELAGQPKPPPPFRADMEVERAEPRDHAENHEAEDDAAAEGEHIDMDMDASASASPTRQRRNRKPSSSSSSPTTTTTTTTTTAAAAAAAAAAPTPRSTNSLKRQKAHKAARIEKKKRDRKPRNAIVFAKHPKKAPKGSGGRRG